MIESVSHTREHTVSLLNKINPLFWLVGDEGWTVPDINNGEPYLPDIKNIWLRRFYWFFCRNPLMNFVGLVMGVGDRDYDAVGPKPVMATTLRDAGMQGLSWAVLVPHKPSWVSLLFALGWLALALWGTKWAIIPFVFAALKFWGPLPYVNYFGQIGSWWVEAYLGWRPYSGGFGMKLVFPKEP